MAFPPQHIDQGERCRLATQRIIDQIGSVGPESLEGAVTRIVACVDGLEALHKERDQREAGHGEAFGITLDMLAQARKENERLRDALRDAASSLKCLSLVGSRDGSDMLEDLIDVRGYAASRAGVALAALNAAD